MFAYMGCASFEEVCPMYFIEKNVRRIMDRICLWGYIGVVAESC